MSSKPSLQKLQSTKVDIAPPSVILELLSGFLLKFSPGHLDYAASQFYQVASSYTEYIISGHAEPITGIRPIMLAIKKIHEWDNKEKI